MRGFILAVVFTINFGYSQVFSFTTQQEGTFITHRILIDTDYLIETQYVVDPPQFILTRGGFYSKEGNIFSINFEFNSNHTKDGLTNLELVSDKNWNKVSKEPLDLNGKWLMAGRVRDNKEQRRDTSKPRKTMKFLGDGFFQWIAFNTETFEFFGSGGGYYTAKDGIYTEHIEYFSRNNTSVGRVLPFEYSVSGADWHHQGFSSKGDAMHEIWAKRSSNE
ncbi:hypothetical protein OAN60_03885 [Flavobacteriaceae bacterium]|nr:hypothetical protein [Flavobacteriaceae bacterium]